MTAQPAASAAETTTVQRPPIRSVVWFVGLSLALGAGALAGGVSSALLPFVLAVGPAAVALGLAWHEGSTHALLQSMAIRPTDRRWYLVLLIPIVWSVVTVALVIALGDRTVDRFATLFPALLIVPLVVLVPAFTEELAWRGFALSRSLTAMSPLRAALVLAIPWTLIHVALFLPGQVYGDIAAWPMVISIFAYSILLTWIFIGTGGSVLMTALVHAGLNGVAPIMATVDPEVSWIARNLLAAAIAVGVVALGGLRRRDGTA